MLRFMLRLILALLAESFAESLAPRKPRKTSYLHKPKLYMAPAGTPLPLLAPFAASNLPASWKRQG